MSAALNPHDEAGLERLASALGEIAGEERRTRALADTLGDAGTSAKAERELLALMRRSSRKGRKPLLWALAAAALVLVTLGLRTFLTNTPGLGPGGPRLGKQGLELILPENEVSHLAAIRWKAPLEAGTTFALYVYPLEPGAEHEHADFDHEDAIFRREGLTGLEFELQPEESGTWPARVLIEIDQCGPDGPEGEPAFAELQFSSR